MHVEPLTLIVFVLVYLGMILGGLPGLAIDRTGVALVGAIVLLAAGRVTLEQAWSAIDLPTMALLLGLPALRSRVCGTRMIAYITRRIGADRRAANSFPVALG